MISSFMVVDNCLWSRDQARTAGAPCQVRAYAFDGAAGRNGARTGMSVTNHPDDDCASATGESRSVSQSFDTGGKFGDGDKRLFNQS